MLTVGEKIDLYPSLSETKILVIFHLVGSYFIPCRTNYICQSKLVCSSFKIYDPSLPMGSLFDLLTVRVGGGM